MESLITFDGLMEAARQCSRSVKWKDSIAAWVHPRNLAINCLKLKEELDNGTYRLGGYVIFEVTEPKRRTIRSPKFRDRVVQRAMCNAGLYHDLTRGNIYDNGACQTGKGTSFAMDRLACQLQRFWREHGNEGWVLKLDIRKFFDSIPHDKLKEMVDRKVVNEQFKQLTKEVIDSFEGDKGIGLGSQLSQLLAISYLSELDHYIKEKSGIKYYERYSDDSICICHDKKMLLKAWADILAWLKEHGLELNPKSVLHPLRQGVKFLKFKFVLTDTGKVIRILNRRSYARITRRLRRLVNMVSAGTRTPQDAIDCFNSWKAHAEQGNTHRRIRTLNKWLLTSLHQIKLQENERSA